MKKLLLTLALLSMAQIEAYKRDDNSTDDYYMPPGSYLQYYDKYVNANVWCQGQGSAYYKQNKMLVFPCTYYPPENKSLQTQRSNAIIVPKTYTDIIIDDTGNLIVQGGSNN